MGRPRLVGPECGARMSGYRIQWGKRSPAPRGNLQRVFPEVMLIGGHRFPDGRHANTAINRHCYGCSLEAELSAVYREWRQDVEAHSATRRRPPWRPPT